MNIYYTATAKFSPTTSRTYQGHDLNWHGYIAWSKLTQVKEIITLDLILGKVVVKTDIHLDADFLVWEDFFPDAYTSLDYLLLKLEGTDPATYNLLAVAKEPTEPCDALYLEDFEFIGYDLVDRKWGMSALTNCGGFDNTFLPKDLNEYGLIQTYEKAFKIRDELLKNNPEEHHADCHVWAIWRMK